jgi:hypothetical protein
MYGPSYGGSGWSGFINANNFSGGCMLDGMSADCNRVKQLVNDGLATVNVRGGLTDSTRFRPQTPFGYFEIRGEHNSGSFITGPVFGDDPQNPLVNQDAWERRHITSNACGHMADVAQQQANRALRQTHGNASRALGAFDLGFSRIYAGKPMDGISNAIDLYQNGPTGRTIGSYYQGETGFKVHGHWG